jgi:hypothetical protein
MTESWLRPHEAVAIIKQRQGGSVGRAEATLRAAKDSGEVRCQDGWIQDFSVRPHGIRKISKPNKDDLLAWLDRPPIAPPSRPRANRAPRSKLALEAAAEIWGPHGPPHLPPQDIFKKVADHVQKHHGVEISKSQVLRALGLK